jgi:hypothetical protein
VDTALGIDIRQTGTNVARCFVLKISDSVMKERTTDLGNFSQPGRRVDLKAATAQTATDSGIEVQEEEWGTATLQHVYKVRCECGRSWFELEPPRFVKCPACHKLSLVSA